MASTFTQNLSLENPTPADPATNNVWGTTENTGRTLVDSAVAGILSLNVAGNSNVVLTSNQGAADQSRNAHFVLTGALTGNINVLWPNGKTRVFSVFNNTSGAFTLSVGVNNGAGSPAGTTVSVPQGFVGQYVSDGTNCSTRINAVALPDYFPSTTRMLFIQAAAPTGWTLVNSFNDSVLRVNTAGGGTTGGSWTISGATVGSHALTTAEMPTHNHQIGFNIVTTPGGANAFQQLVDIAGAGGSVNSASTGNGSGHTHTWSNDATWRPLYVDSIVCSKN